MRIYFIGFMGTGKSYAGKALANHLHYTHYDLDDLLEKKEKTDINQIFDEFGESYFREVESRTLLSSLEDGVYSCGGGVIEKAVNRDFLQKQENYVIWIDTSWQTIITRIGNSERPLVKANTITALKKLYERRQSYYSQVADLRVDSFDLDYIIKKIPQ